MPEKPEPRDLAALERAVNDAAKSASGLWISFIVFATYLVIATGSVTHQHLFLETAVKLPVLNVELPLAGFFVVAPLFFLIFHFYLFLQLHGLAGRIADYDALLHEEAPEGEDRRRLRQRLDTFVFVQVLAGARERRAGRIGFLLRAVAWLTVVGIPLALLLQMLIVFLPYHKEWVTWLHRLAILADLALVWIFWQEIAARETGPAAPAAAVQEPMKDWTSRWAKLAPGWLSQSGVARKTGDIIRPWWRPVSGWFSWRRIAAAMSGALALFAVFIAVFPGETIYFYPGRWLTGWLFEGPADEVKSRSTSLFANRLVLPDQDFVEDDKLDKVEVTHSLRGRDLRQAVLDRADLRQADFTGADLRGASLNDAKLQKARFLCAKTGRKETEEQASDDSGCARLQGAWLDGAQLQGASLRWARLQGASLRWARLQGASLQGAQLQGAWLVRARLQGASLAGMYIYRLARTSIGLENVYLAEVNKSPVIRASPFGEDELKGGEQGDYEKFVSEVVKDLPSEALKDEVRERLARLAPGVPPAEHDKADADFWTKAEKESPSLWQHQATLAGILEELACAAEGAPQVARGLIGNGRLEATGQHLRAIAAKLKNPAECPGAKGLSDEDLATVNR